MIDALLQYLLEEVAMDGDAGTSLPVLAQCIEHFYARAASSSTTDDPARLQKVDASFLSFVWDALLEQPDVRLGVLVPIPGAEPAPPPAPAPAPENPSAHAPEASTSAAAPERDGAEEEAKPASEAPKPEEEKKVKKQGGRKKRDPNEGPTHEMRFLEDGDERAKGLEQLQSEYGENLRVIASEETAWKAIVGTHAKISSITPPIYSVLQLVSRGRGDGATAVRIAKDLALDPKSVFHMVKVPQQLGLVKKFSDVDQGCRTNRVVHVRYLASSPAWLAHIASEPDAAASDDEAGGGEGGGADEEGAVGGGWGGNEMSPISIMYVKTNAPLIRARIIKALKRRKDGWMPHSEIHASIGLHAVNSQVLRRLNALISPLVAEGIVEKVNVTRKRKGHKDSIVQALRLVQRVKGDEDGVTAAGSHGRVEQREDDDEDDAGSYPVLGRSIERQEISSALGGFSIRFIESMLQRLARVAPPPHLADHTVHSVRETVGRVKQARWFSLAGYLSFRRSQGYPDDALEAKWRALTEGDGARVGAFETPDEDGPAEGQYASLEQRQKRLETFNVWANTTDRVGGGPSVRKYKPRQKKGAAAASKTQSDAGDGSAPATPAPTAAAAKGKGKAKADVKGKGKAVDQDAPAAVDDDVIAAPRVPPPPRTIGRPRKNPLKPGEESPYMRKKRERLEDEERERLGLPPLERPKAKRARKKKDEGEEGKKEGEVGEEKKEKKKAVKGKSKRTEEIANGAADEGEDQLMEDAVEPPHGDGVSTQEQPTPGPSSATAATTETPSASKTSGAPEQTDGPETPAPAAATARPTKKRGRQAAATSTPATAEPPRRLQPYVEVEHSSPVTKHPMRSKALDALAGIHSSSPPPPEIAATDNHAAGLSDSPAQGVAAEAPATPAATVPEVVAPPNATNTAATPKTSAIRVASTAPAASRPKQKPRPSMVSSDNLTALARQKDVVDYISDQGGIIEFAYRLNDSIYAWSKQRNPNAFKLDKKVLQTTLEAAERRGLLLRQVVTAAHGDQRKIYFLPTISTESEQYRNFVKTLVETVRSRFADIVHDKNIVLDEVVETDLREADAAGLDEPSPTDSPDDVRLFFSKQVHVVSRKYGVRPGLAARARALHKWLASWLLAQPDDSDVFCLREEHADIVTQKKLLDSMPLGVFVRIVPLPFESDTLATFLEDADNRRLAMADLPRDIVDIIRPHDRKRKAALWKTLDALNSFRLLQPVMPVDDTLAKFQPAYMPKLAQHWRFNRIVPVYAFREDPADVHRLINVFEFESSDDVVEYWRAVEAGTRPLPLDAAGNERPADFDAIADDRFPPDAVMTNVRTFIKNMRGPTKWRDAYSMAPPQAAFLTKLVMSDPGLVTDKANRQDDIAKWAHAVYAPVADVEAFLANALYRPRAAPGSRRAKKRQRKSLGGADGIGAGQYGDEEEEEGDENEDPEAAAERARNAAATVHRKVQDAAAQRERDWNAILERFRAEHDQPTLDATTVDWLHRTFLDPRKQLDAKQLDFELRRLLPEDAQAMTAADAAMRSQVPSGLQKRASDAKKPYAVAPRGEGGKKRRAGSKRKTSAVESERVKAAVDSIGDEPEAATLVTMAEDQPVQTGTQSEFLEVPLPPHPDLPKGKRLSRNHYTSEQDELLLDAFAVLRARSHISGMRIGFGAFEKFFEGNKPKTLRVRTHTLLKKTSEQEYHDRLVDAYVRVFREHGRSIPDPKPLSMLEFDLGANVRLLREKVNKRQPQVALPAVQLPSTIAEFEAQFHIMPTEHAVKLSNRFEKTWAKYHIATNVREDAAAAAPLGKPWASEAKVMEPHRSREMTAAALKAIVSTPVDAYDVAKGSTLLEPFATRVDGVVEELLRAQIIEKLHSEEDRRQPGRNFVFTDKFFQRFDNTATMTRLGEASAWDDELRDCDEFEFPLIPNEGQMLAFFDLISEGTVELAVDTSTLTDKTRDLDFWQTRQANDDDIECTINVLPLEALDKKEAVPLPTTLLPASVTDDAAALAQAKSDLPVDAEAALALEKALSAAGAEGIALKTLSTVLVGHDRAAILSAVSLLTTTSSPPLALLAGHAALSLVHARYLSSWAFPVPSSDPKRYFLPALWTGVSGEVNFEYWQRACAWVKGELLARSGITCPALVARAQARGLLGAHEVQRILLRLLEAGKVARRSLDSVAGGGLAEGEIDWEGDRWFLDGTCW
ncbi:hypothetical protein Rhopal_006980-T1 [Rhodotorula paludigena]|uniref:Transcription factor tau subunit sfc3/Tfc3 C-terminal domain-containing protein n=1 Tax=Rhodotorula paludigena TaxID=86838 RepID=A0AAV5GNK8_9BASI|nr:hypothetical protein Rhopal_006980-T1 [Rhodotorula paludigena]